MYLLNFIVYIIFFVYLADLFILYTKKKIVYTRVVFFFHKFFDIKAFLLQLRIVSMVLAYTP